MTDATHDAYEAFLKETGDAVDALLNAKDIAAELPDFANIGGELKDVRAELSDIVRRIHDLQDTVPGFQD
jgi:hypothetical protein